MLNIIVQEFIKNELLHTIVLLGGFSYVIGVMFLPLLVQDILIGAIPHKWSSRIWKCQFYPIVNFILFVSIFTLTLLFLIVWLPIKKLVWNLVYYFDCSKYYRELIVPKKYKLPERFKK